MKRMYDCQRWRKLRIRFLRDNPMCVMCERMGRDNAATVVDHIVPHKDDYEKFWDENNLQSLCPTCHSGLKRIQENSGVYPGCDVYGMPIDPGHEWSRKVNIMNERKLYRKHEVLNMLGISDPTLWRMEKRGDFPKRVKISKNIAGWFSDEVDEWFNNKQKDSRQKKSS